MEKDITTKSAKIEPPQSDSLPTQGPIAFDPYNSEHRIAYVMLAHEQKQHPTLRFFTPEQKTTLDMMRCKLADALAINEIKLRCEVLPKSVTIMPPEFENNIDWEMGE